MKNIEAIEKLVASIKENAQKFYNKGNNAAGTRVRKGMQDLKKLATDVRNEVTTIKADRNK